MSGVTKFALLIDYEYCTGCHSCETACKKELGLPFGQYGIKLLEYGPVEVSPDKWELNYIPFPTSLCDLCPDRVDLGKLPACVHNCQAKCMQFGRLDELIEVMDYKPNQVMWAPR
jgi:Fe-S-cluster-containing dehydrogenase component